MAEVRAAQKNTADASQAAVKVEKKASAKKVADKPVIKTAAASARFLHLSPRKARLVTNLVNHMWAGDALAQLQFVHKKSAAIVRDVIKSAMANAENNFKLKKEDLFIKSITADGGAKLKRYKPRAQGRASEIRRPLTHINVLLEERLRSGKSRKFTLGVKKTSEAKGGEAEEKTTKEQLASEANKPAIRDQVEKTSQDIKKQTVTQKRRLFNRKSGV